jgi:histone deacetylase 11
MIAYFRPDYDFRLGPLGLLHPFDGRKFSKIRDRIVKIKREGGIDFATPSDPISSSAIDSFVGELMGNLLTSKRYILQALEVPYLPLIPFSVIDNRILGPMRWAVAGTLAAARSALDGQNAWNLSGGYHHASRKTAEGFCIYNDIGIAYDQLVRDKRIDPIDRILIVDVDAHHGNGNAYVFLDNDCVSILDVYNRDIYPVREFTRNRVNIGVPLSSGTEGAEYLFRLSDALAKIEGTFKLAFVVAGTEVLASDPLGRLGLSIADCVARDRMIMERLTAVGVPFVLVGGGGYGPESAEAVASSIIANSNF